MADENLATKADLQALKVALVESTKADIEASQEMLLERIEKTETTLLQEFRKWGISFRSRFRANEILVGGFSERLIALEERVSDIEGKSRT